MNNEIVEPARETQTSILNLCDVLLVAGEGHGNLKACFKPAPINNEVDLTEHLKTTKVGWYVVRLYDAHEVLVDDGHYFAFSRLLRDIKVSGAPVLPGADGHSKTRLEFEHDAEAAEAFFGEQELEALPIDGGTAFSVPPRCEQVHWQIGCTGESPLKCTTRIERLWWAVRHSSATREASPALPSLPRACLANHSKSKPSSSAGLTTGMWTWPEHRR